MDVVVVAMLMIQPVIVPTMIILPVITVALPPVIAVVVPPVISKVDYCELDKNSLLGSDSRKAYLVSAIRS